jgi:hypothetical protein
VREFIDQHRDVFGVESICKQLQIAPSGYWRYAAQRRNPALRCARAQRDEVLSMQINHVWHANMQVYGADVNGGENPTINGGVVEACGIFLVWPGRQTRFLGKEGMGRMRVGGSP